MPDKIKNSVEVCFSPKLYEHRLTKDNFIVVIVDILRATTSICAAFDHGVEKIIPVAGIEKAREYKEKGYTVACERDGKVLDFADVGNSPSDFLKDSFRGNTIAYSTTNGTKAINLASDADEIVIGSFTNLTAISNWLTEQGKNVVILCAAWKGLFNLEDSLFAGALSEKLLDTGLFKTECDSVKAGMDLWSLAREDLAGYLSKSSHRNRLKHLVSNEDFQYTVTQDSNRVIPRLESNYLINPATD
jgi:2-phosphosulfolactate phosphatase